MRGNIFYCFLLFRISRVAYDAVSFIEKGVVMITSKKSCLLKGIGVWGAALLVSCGTACDQVNTQNSKIPLVIDKYVQLCLQLERVAGSFEYFEYTDVRQLIFTHPSIIYCYNQIIAQRSLKPLAHLWLAYKNGMIVVDKQKFVYELCRLIALIFEQFLIRLASELTGQSPQSVVELLNKLHIDLLFDDLIVVLEQCYEQLSHIASDLNTPQNVHVRKRTVAALLAVVSMIIARYLYKIALGSGKLVATNSQDPSLVSSALKNSSVP